MTGLKDEAYTLSANHGASHGSATSLRLPCVGRDQISQAQEPPHDQKLSFYEEEGSAKGAENLLLIPYQTTVEDEDSED